MKNVCSVIHLDKNGLKLVNLIQGFKISFVIIACVYRGVFEKIQDGCELDVLKKELGKDIEALLEVLIAHSILNKNDSIITISDDVKNLFIHDNEDYLGDFILWQSFQVNKYFQLIPNELRYFDRKRWICALDQLSNAQKNPDRFVVICNNFKICSLIDFGGGSGIYSKKFVDNIPNAKSVILETEEMIPYTKLFISEKYNNKINIYESSENNIASLPDYDAILLSNVIHGKEKKFIMHIVKTFSDKVSFFIFHNPLTMYENKFQKEGTLMNLTMLKNNGIGNYSEIDITQIMQEYSFVLMHKELLQDSGAVILVYAKY